MMIVDCKVELDWIEDGSIDDVVRQAIIDTAIEKIGASISEKVDSMAVEILNTRVNSMIDDIWENFMEKRVNITDKYGDPVESHESIKDMLKSRLDGFVNQRVDREGKPLPSGKCGYNDAPRLEWLMGEVLRKHTEPFMKSVQQDFELRMKAALNDGLKKSLSESMLKNVDVAAIMATVKGA